MIKQVFITVQFAAASMLFVNCATTRDGRDVDSDWEAGESQAEADPDQFHHGTGPASSNTGVSGTQGPEGPLTGNIPPLDTAPGEPYPNEVVPEVQGGQAAQGTTGEGFGATGPGVEYDHLKDRDQERSAGGQAGQGTMGQSERTDQQYDKKYDKMDHQKMGHDQMGHDQMGQGGQGGQGTMGQSDQMRQGTMQQGGQMDQMAGPIDTKTFVNKAAMDSMFEVQLGTLAQSKASNADVKSFATQMINDHTRANNELKGLVANKRFELPKELDAEHKQIINRMTNMSGREFDRAYMDHMVKDHEKAVNLFQQASRTVDDPELKAWATRTVPVLQQHLQRAKEINKRVMDQRETRAF